MFYLSSISFSLFFTTPLFELHTTHVHDSGGDAIDVILFILGEAQHIEGFLYFLKQVKDEFFGRQEVRF